MTEEPKAHRVSDIVERLRAYAGDDHERGCQGRYYDCSCGYDDKRDPLLTQAADEIERLRAKVDDWQAMKDERDDALCNLATLRLDLEGDIYMMQAENAKLRAAALEEAAKLVDYHAAAYEACMSRGDDDGTLEAIAASLRGRAANIRALKNQNPDSAAGNT